MKKLNLLLFLVIIQSLIVEKLVAQSIINDSTEIKILTKADSFLVISSKPAGYVNDYARLYFKNEIRNIENIIKAYEKKTTVEIALVTIDTKFVGKENFDSLANHLLNSWGVGKKVKNNGILILICKQYRKMRISNGYGIEKILTDAETKLIIDKSFIPYFKKDEYYTGTINGLKKIMSILNSKLKLKK
jgi:uncharacterized protein